MRGLQDEVECLKVQLLMQEKKHNEDIALLKQQHTDEIQRYKMLLQNAKLAHTSVNKFLKLCRMIQKICNFI